MTHAPPVVSFAQVAANKVDHRADREVHAAVPATIEAGAEGS